MVSVKVFITRIKGHPLLGCPNRRPLPLRLANCRALWKFENDSNNRPYNDRKCALRCAAFHLLRTNQVKNRTRRVAGLSRKVENLRLAYCQFAKVDLFKEFPGISLANIHHLEDAAKVNINIFAYYDSSEPVGKADGAAVEGEEFVPDDMDDILNEWENRPEGLAGETFLNNNSDLQNDVSDNHCEVEEETEPFFQIVRRTVILKLTFLYSGFISGSSIALSIQPNS